MIRKSPLHTIIIAIATLLLLPLTIHAVSYAPPMFGVNLAGAEFGSNVPGSFGSDYTYPTTANLDYYKARGIELIRLPFKWERIQKTLYGPLDPDELARLDEFFDAAEDRSMRVILDMHNYARYRISGTSYRIGEPQIPRTAFHDIWARLAAHFEHRDGLWAYGIMNEPYGMSSYTWKDSAQYAVNGIRQHDQLCQLVPTAQCARLHRRIRRPRQRPALAHHPR